MTEPHLTGARTDAAAGGLADRYLDLLKGCLTRDLFEGEEVRDVLSWPPDPRIGDPTEVWDMFTARGWRLVRPLDRESMGQDHVPSLAETMVGRARLDNIQDLVSTVVAEEVPGDLVETGVWRGGSVIFMRAVLSVLGDTERQVWVCDSFEGLPDPDVANFPADEAMEIEDVALKRMVDEGLAVSVDQVKRNFARYGLLDDQVRFLPGWFRDSLPDAPIEQIAVLRLDGDLYESTMDALVHLEPKVTPGGFVIIDDYGALEPCRTAVEEYRADKGIVDPISKVDWTGVYWRKSAR